MKKFILDSSILIAHWRQQRSKWRGAMSLEGVIGWAKQLMEFHDTKAIVTPVYVEVVAGVTSRHELPLTKAFLGKFERVDKGNIIRDDWDDAIRLAQRIPRHGGPRDLGDCLIRAIADRLRYEVKTLDKKFVQ